MDQRQFELNIPTRGPGLYEITDRLAAFIEESGIKIGLLTLFCRHTSCSLLIGENADPDVQIDLRAYFDRLAPQHMDYIIHKDEGPDDMPAHLKTSLTQTTLGIPVAGGRMVLGTWQGVFLFEHRARPHRRLIVLHLMGT